MEKAHWSRSPLHALIISYTIGKHFATKENSLGSVGIFVFSQITQSYSSWELLGAE